jgi:hypothetical protein
MGKKRRTAAADGMATAGLVEVEGGTETGSGAVAAK